jgi:hypothetical protein
MPASDRELRSVSSQREVPYGEGSRHMEGEQGEKAKDLPLWVRSTVAILVALAPLATCVVTLMR